MGADGDAFVAGVDGGATRTRAVVLDASGREVGRGEAGSALAEGGRPEAAAGAVADAVAAAARDAGVEGPLAAVWAGLTGMAREPVRSSVEAALRAAAVAPRVRVGTDLDAAFHDAFEEGPGLLLLAGTGSVAVGRAEDGRQARVGGWGPWLGDEGSGWAVGLEGLRRVMRAADGRDPATTLAERILERVGLAAAEDLVGWVAAARRPEVAALAPVVAEAASEGDAVAADVLVEAAEALEAHVAALLEELGPWAHPPTLALAGGLLQPGGPLRAAVEGRAAARRLPLLGRTPDAALGAARMALELLGGR